MAAGEPPPFDAKLRLHLLLVGPPGAGKGSVARKLEPHGLEHVSSGAIFRNEVEKGTPFGNTFAKGLKQGSFVPDEATLGIMRKWFFARKGRKGFLLDGFPRNLLQAQVFDEWMETTRQSLDGCLFLDISFDEAVRRITGRRSCPVDGAVYHLHFHPPKEPEICDRCGGRLVQRPDDTRETVLRRWKIFEEKTRPMLGHYEQRGVLYRIDAAQPLDDVVAKTEELLRGLCHDDSDQKT